MWLSGAATVTELTLIPEIPTWVKIVPGPNYTHFLLLIREILFIDKENKGKQDRKRSIAFLISMLRGFFAILLGLILIFNSEKTGVMLLNFMGLFWVTSGIILIRGKNVAFGDQTDRVLGKRMSLALSLVAILTGLLVISRSLTRNWVGETVFFELLGAVIVLTGVLHLFGEFRIGRVIKHKRTMAPKNISLLRDHSGCNADHITVGSESLRLLGSNHLGIGRRSA